jgi:hypothetical protein
MSTGEADNLSSGLSGSLAYNATWMAEGCFQFSLLDLPGVEKGGASLVRRRPVCLHLFFTAG